MLGVSRLRFHQGQHENEHRRRADRRRCRRRPRRRDQEGLKIAFLPKQINNPYFAISDDGGQDAVKEVKGEFKRVGPSDTAASSQVTYINTLTTQKQDAIVISANDANAVVPALKKAMAPGIKVVTFDSDTAPDGRNMFINQATAEDIGRSADAAAGQAIGGGGARSRSSRRRRTPRTRTPGSSR